MGKKEEIADLFNKQDESETKAITEDDLKSYQNQCNITSDIVELSVWYL